MRRKASSTHGLYFYSVNAISRLSRVSRPVFRFLCVSSLLTACGQSPTCSSTLRVRSMYYSSSLSVVSSRRILSDLRAGRQGQREPRHHVLYPPDSPSFLLRPLVVILWNACVRINCNERLRDLTIRSLFCTVWNCERNVCRYTYTRRKLFNYKYCHKIIKIIFLKLLLLKIIEFLILF